MNRYLVLLAPLLLLLGFHRGEMPDFINNNIPAATDRAAQEGKLTVVAFGAKWCQPCVFMDDNTWSNPNVVEYMKAHCVAVKVDVDDYKGQVYRDQYGIKYYPSVLIFNSKGQLLHKHEGLLGAESMVGLLQTYASMENQSRVNSAPTADRSFAEPEAEVIEKPHVLPPAYTDRPSPSDNDNPDDVRDLAPESGRAHVNISPRALHGRDKTTAVKPGRIAAKPAKPSPAPSISRKPAPAAPKSKAPAAVSPRAKKPSAKSGFTVQVGVYMAKAAAEKEAQKVVKKFGKTGSAVGTMLKGKTVFRGVVGEFGDRATAGAFRQKMEKSGFKGLVKAWAELN